jgi:hypothetical protein
MGKGLFCSLAFCGWVKNLGWGVSEGWMVLWGLRWEETYFKGRWAEARSC